jgi:hypothetical protein
LPGLYLFLTNASLLANAEKIRKPMYEV